MKLHQTDDVIIREGGNAFSLSKQYANISLEKKDLLSKNEFLEGQLKTLNQKLFLLEKNNEEFEHQKEKLNIIRLDLEIKVQRKSQKNKVLKKEKEEIIAKLENFIDKDSANKQILKKKNWEFEKDQQKFEAKERDLNEYNEKLVQDNKELKEEIQSLQAEIARLNDSLNSLRNRLNDEFLKNKKNTKLMIGLHKENKDQILKRSSTYENDEKDIEKNSNMLPFSQTSVKSRINGFEFEARTEESVKKYSIDLDENEKSDQNKKSEDYIENSSKNEEFNGDIAKANDKELQQENNKKPINSKIETNFEESGKSEAKKQNEKKIIQKAKSKKSVFSKQPSAKTFLKSASKDIKEENTLVDSKQNETKPNILQNCTVL